MSAARLSVTLPSDEAEFRRRCIALGRARDEKEVAELVASSGERFDRDLFAAVWHKAETTVRTRVRKTERLRKWGNFIVAAWMLGLLVYLIISGDKGFLSLQPVLVFPYAMFNIGMYFVEFKWAQRRSLLQQGMTRLLLRRGSTEEDVGYLIDISRFHLPKSLLYEEFYEVAIKALTQLLPLAVQTDSLKLDQYQRDILRQQIVSMAQHLTSKKPGALHAEHADFTAAALLAVNALGELKGNSREHRAAHAAVKKLAEATPRPDETLNHSYVREVARETLPLLHVGKKAS